MLLDASTFRNLGVECLLINCRMCGRPERYAIYENGSGQAFFIGCTQCGVNDPIDKEVFDALYELSDSYESLMSGETTVERFEKAMPAFIREFYINLNEKGDSWKCSECGSTSPIENLECWNCGKSSRRELEPNLITTGFKNPEEELEAQKSTELGKQRKLYPEQIKREYRSVRLSNTLTSSWMMAPVYTIPIAVGIVAIEATGLFRLPFVHFLSGGDTVDYAVLKPFQYWNDFIWPVILLQFILFPIFVGFLHFKIPKAVLFSLGGIEVRYRSGRKITYQFKDVVRSDYNPEKNFIKMKMNDGKNVRVEVDIGQAASLRDYLTL